jgi:hypothetical protein
VTEHRSEVAQDNAGELTHAAQQSQAPARPASPPQPQPASGPAAAADPSNIFQVLSIVYRWAVRAPTRSRRVLRLTGFATIGLVALLFFVDFTGGSSPIARNVRVIRGWFDKSFVPKAGFFNEEFYGAALRSADSRFWASGVSFRNLVAGNKEELTKILARNVEFRIILLDPDSALAQDDGIRQFSRTATAADIRNTLTALNGLVAGADPAVRREVWTSPYAPVVPMVVVDDEVYASFQVHVDQKRVRNAYNAEYLTFPADSEMGKRLLAHFNDMLAAPAARKVSTR